MRVTRFRPATLLLVAICGACGSSPVMPSTARPSQAVPGPGSSPTPTLVSTPAWPADGAEMAVASLNLIPGSQPAITLVAGDAPAPHGLVVVDTFELSRFSSFVGGVSTMTVSRSAQGTTTVTMGELVLDVDYYWRLRAVSGDTVGP